VAVQFQGWVTLRRGDHETAAACAEELLERAAQLGTAEYLTPAYVLAAEIASERGDDRTMLARLDDFGASTAAQPTYRAGFLPLAIRLLARAGERERAAGLMDVDAAAAGASRRLRLSVDTAAATFEERWGDPAVAFDLSSAVAKGWEAYGFPLESALCRVGAARCLVRLGRSEEAAAALAQARASFEALGARAFLDDLEAIARGA
jgi:hypothetical protein